MVIWVIDSHVARMVHSVAKTGQASTPDTGQSLPTVNLMRDLQGFNKTNEMYQLLPAIVDALDVGKSTLVRGLRNLADQPLGRFMGQRQSCSVGGENE
jgi:hypothetical protein